MSAKLDVVAGAQYGSEAKGHLVADLATRRMEEGLNPLVVRVAGPNAGHTGYDSTGKPWALRSMPVAAVVPGNLTLAVAPGSELDPEVFLDEFDRLHEAGLMDGKSMVVSGEATVLTQEHKDLEATQDLTGKVGSTGKGIGASRAARMMRTAQRVQDNDEFKNQLLRRPIRVLDAPEWENFIGGHLSEDQTAIIVEGTQGFALGLHAGYYPQCTSSNTRAIDFLAMAGVNPWQVGPHNLTVWVVARVYPIRVAGNSGPLKDETSWDELGLEPELTTVTQKVRRVGGEDWDLVRRAVEANGSSNVVLALSMVDQRFPEVAGKDHLPSEARDWVRRVQDRVGVPIGWVGTGPNSHVWMLKDRLRTLRNWWMQQAAEEADSLIPKSVEYGAHDLEEMGRAVSWISKRDMTKAEQAEFGIYWYALGKMARWGSAIEQGRQVSDDTLLDLGIYARMAQRVREAGGWPG
ncbi:succino-amino-deoxyadenylate synthase PurZ, partial [Candidatus Darwinibacter acetoxidans]